MSTAFLEMMVVIVAHYCTIVLDIGGEHPGSNSRKSEYDGAESPKCSESNGVLGSNVKDFEFNVQNSMFHVNETALSLNFELELGIITR